MTKNFFTDIPQVNWKVENGLHGPAHPKFATVLSIPVILSLLFLIPHWWRAEKTSSMRLITLPLLLLQLWPQWRVVKLILMIFKDEEKYCVKRTKYDMDLTSLEQFTEAVPTVYILLIIWLRDRYIFGGFEHNFLGIPKQNMFYISFGISIFSGSLGMAKFLKLGPCQIVHSRKMHCGFFLLFLSIVCTHISKIFVFGIALGSDKKDDVIQCVIWICTSVLPQLILVSNLLFFIFKKNVRNLNNY